MPNLAPGPVTPGGPGSDTDAIDDNVAGQIAAIALKAAPVAGDKVVIEDSADSDAKKSATLGSLPVAAHAAAHENGGADEINVNGLGGVLADGQPGLSHALGGAKHVADTLANLNAKVSDATLIDTGDSRLSDARVPTGTAGGDLGGTYPNPTVDDGADSTAIHQNVASEIAGVTPKAAPVDGDFVLIEDSASGNVKKSVTFSDMPFPSTAPFVLENVIRDTIAANQNDYAPTGFAAASALIVDGGAADRDITGIDATGRIDGSIVKVFNSGTTKKLKFKNQDAGSTAANRFILSNLANLDVRKGGSVEFMYDATATRWRVSAEAK